MPKHSQRNDDDTTNARARTRNRAVTAGALSHGTTAARECRRTTSASQPANPIKLAKMA
jgi:hypothetical protein